MYTCNPDPASRANIFHLLWPQPHNCPPRRSSPANMLTKGGGRTCWDAKKKLNRTTKVEMKELRIPDLLGQRKAGWNNTSSGSRFPDRPMMRQLSAYDSIKRADLNFRAEEIDSKATALYAPRPSKLQTNATALSVPCLEHVHPISRTEFPNHSSLASKPRWDPATGHGGDQYGAEKLRERSIEHETLWALDYAKKHPPKHRTETLIQREERFMAEKRDAIRAARAAPASARASTAPATVAQLMGRGSVSARGELRGQQVPSKKVTTWSLGGI